MHIKNISKERSFGTICGFALATIIYSAFFVVPYIVTSIEPLSLVGFCNYYVGIYNSLAEELGSDKWLAVASLIATPIFIFVGFIVSIIKRQQAANKFKKELNIQSIDLLEGMINFNFNKPNCNFSCSYTDIEHLEMNIETEAVHTKNGTQIIPRQIRLRFKVLNNKTFTLYNKNTSYNFVYKILDFSKYVKDFSYSFIGAGQAIVYKEKIDAYIQNGTSEILTDTEELVARCTSVFFFIIGIIFLSTCCDYKNYSLANNYYLVAGLFAPILISLIIDSFILADKIKERRTRG